MTSGEFRRALKRVGMTQADFARFLSDGDRAVSPHTVGNWANERRPVPTWAPAVLALLAIVKHAATAVEIIEHVDHRCLAGDGPVTDWRAEMTNAEARKQYRAVKAIARIADTLDIER